MTSIYSCFAIVVTLLFSRWMSEIILHTSFIDILRSFNDGLHARVIRCCTGYNAVLVNSEHTQVCAHVTAAHASSAAFSAIPISAVHMSC